MGVFFWQKTEKKDIKKNPSVFQMNKKNTIDEVHTEKLKTFHQFETLKKVSLKQEKKNLQIKLKSLCENQIDEIMETKDKILSISKEIRDISLKKKSYLLKNSKEIFHYFEEKQRVSSGNNNQNTNVLNTFFKIKQEDALVLPSNQYSQFKVFYKNYWKNVNNEILNVNKIYFSMDVCEICGSGEMIPQEEEGVLICNNRGCGRYVMHIVDSSKPSNKEPPNEVSYTAYIRLNHFKEILSQFQAKETTQIPTEVIDSIKMRLKKERIVDTSVINYKTMRDILRKLGLNKYFEHIQFINSLFGIQPPIMDDKLTETLCFLFIEIQQPWSLYCPPERVNFFNYTYTLYQLCVLLDQPQYLPFIPLLKDNLKQKQQDDIWKMVCRDLDWQFFPTVWEKCLFRNYNIRYCKIL